MGEAANDDRDRDRDAAELVRSNERLRTLAEASKAFATAVTDYRGLLATIARVCADLVGDGCMVTLIDADGDSLVNVANAHRDPAREADYAAFMAALPVAKKSTSGAVSAGVIRTGGAVLAPEVDPDALTARSDPELRPIVARLDVRSFAVVAIRARNAIIGSLSLQRSGPGRSYTADDVTVLQDLADRAGLAISNARIYDDLERRVRLRTAELESVNKELDAFSHSVAHDLRAPLRAITGFAQAVVEDHAAALGDDGLAHVGRIRSAALRMGQLIDDLLRLARVGRAELNLTDVDLSAMALEVLAEQTPIRDIKIAIQDNLVVRADAALLRIAMTNLLGNAWKFTGRTADAAIEVGAETTGDAPVYFVRDNGAGFDMSQARHLFGAFQRLHPAAEFEGTGIGLAIVQRIVHRHGGRVWAEAAAGRGATFRFTLGR